LEHDDFNRRLIVGSGGEHFALASGDGGVGVDEFGHHAAEGLDAHAQRHHVEQNHVFHVATEHTALNAGADGHNLVGVNALVRFLAEDFFNLLLDGGDTA